MRFCLRAPECVETPLTVGYTGLLWYDTTMDEVGLNILKLLAKMGS